MLQSLRLAVAFAFLGPITQLHPLLHCSAGENWAQLPIKTVVWASRLAQNVC